MNKFIGYISFQRKRDENAYEAIERLDKKLEQVQFNISQWITMPTVFGISQTHKYEDNKQFLLAIRTLFLEEINQRHNNLMEILSGLTPHNH